jgi:hypothetical protein
MSIMDISECVGHSFPRAFTQSNITAGFRVAGICPLNRDVFTDDEFLSSYVTDRPYAEPLDGSVGQQPIETDIINGSANEQLLTSGQQTEDLGLNERTAACDDRSVTVQEHEDTSANDDISDMNLGEGVSSVLSPRHVLTPEQLRPFPKAAARKGQSCRKRRKSQVLTDTPVKNQLEEESKKSKSKKSKKLYDKVRNPFRYSVYSFRMAFYTSTCYS